MAEKFIYLSNEFGSVASHLIGDTATELFELERAGVNTPKSLVIPVNTLKIIAQANNLQAHCYTLLQNTTFSSSLSVTKTADQLKKLVEKQTVPKDLGSQLLKTYHTFFSDDFVKVQSSNRVRNTIYALENIHSDTNMVTSILELWAEIISVQIHQMQAKQHSLHEILFATPILISKQAEPTKSGVALTFDDRSGAKQRISVHSSWGVYTAQTDHDSYYVDIRTKNITQKSVPKKSSQYRRVLGSLRKDEVLKQKHDVSTLSEKEINQLLEAVTSIKKKYLSQLEIGWAYVHDRLIIESVEPVELDFSNKKTSSSEKQTKQIFSTIPVNQSTTTISESIDGLAVLNSELLLAITGTHPQEIAKSKQREHLVSAVSKKISKFVTTKNLPLIYRANNFTSHEFRQLKGGSVFEAPETNPALGYRGGIRYLSQSAAFEIELEILQNILQKTTKKVGLLLPFIRSASELQQVLSKLKNEGLLEHSHFSVWLELSTPANILELSEYPVQKLGGLVLNTKSIHTLAYGFDPHNPEMMARYPYSIPLLKTFLQSAIDTLKEKTRTISNFDKPNLYIDLSSFNKQVLEELYDLEIAGFIVNESVTDVAKKCMIKKEQHSVV